MNIERERRWALDRLPSAEEFMVIGAQRIEQAYIGDFNRIRRTEIVTGDDGSSRFYFDHTTKYQIEEDPRTRLEIEEEITNEAFNLLVAFRGLNLSGKVRLLGRLIGEKPFGGPTISCIDIYEDGRFLFEVEFESKEAMENYTPPAWAGEEVTMQPDYGLTLFSAKNSK